MNSDGLLCGFFFFSLGSLSTLAQLGLFAFGATCIAGSSRDDIDDDPAVVFATGGACAVALAQRATVAFCKPHAGNGMMTPALGGLGTIPSHSYYHSERIIQN